MTTARELMQKARERIAENKEQAGTIGAIYRFVLAGDGGGTFTMNLADNPGVYEEEGLGGEPHCTIRMAASDYVDLVEGKTNGQQLFFAGRMKVEGTQGLAAKLQALSEAMEQQ